MFDKVIMKISNWFTEPINEALRKSPEMVAAKTEAGILKAEEDFKSPGRSGARSSRVGLRLVPRHYNKDKSSNKRKAKQK